MYSTGRERPTLPSRAPATSRSAPNVRTCLSLASGSWPGPTRSRSARHDVRHRTNRDESRLCRGPALPRPTLPASAATANAAATVSGRICSRACGGTPAGSPTQTWTPRLAWTTCSPGSIAPRGRTSGADPRRGSTQAMPVANGLAVTNPVATCWTQTWARAWAEATARSVQRTGTLRVAARPRPASAA
jgi:hypothetical protein